MTHENKKALIHNVKLKREPTNDNPTFITKAYRHIMAMLHNKNGNGQPFANV